MNFVLKQRLVAGSLAGVAAVALGVFVMQLMPSDPARPSIGFSRDSASARADAANDLRGDLRNDARSASRGADAGAGAGVGSNANPAAPGGAVNPQTNAGATPPSTAALNDARNPGNSAQLLASISDALQRNDLPTAQRLLDRYHTLYGSGDMMAGSATSNAAYADAGSDDANVGSGKRRNAKNVRNANAKATAANDARDGASKRETRHAPVSAYRTGPKNGVYQGAANEADLPPIARLQSALRAGAPPPLIPPLIKPGTSAGPFGGNGTLAPTRVAPDGPAAMAPSQAPVLQTTSSGSAPSSSRSQVEADVRHARRDGRLPRFGNPDPAGPGGSRNPASSDDGGSDSQ